MENDRQKNLGLKNGGLQVCLGGNVFRLGGSIAREGSWDSRKQLQVDL